MKIVIFCCIFALAIAFAGQVLATDADREAQKIERESDWRVRYNLVADLARTKHDDADEIIIDNALKSIIRNDTNRQIRKLALDKLNEMGNLDFIMDVALTDTDPEVAERAIYELAFPRIWDKEKIAKYESQLLYLVQRPSTSSGNQVRIYAMYALASQEKYHPLLASLAANPAEDGKMRLSALARLKASEFPDLFIRIASFEPDAGLRRVAVEGLDSANQENVSLLYNIATNDPDADIRRVAVSHLPDENQSFFLNVAMYDPDYSTRATARNKLFKESLWTMLELCQRPACVVSSDDFLRELVYQFGSGNLLTVASGERYTDDFRQTAIGLMDDKEARYLVEKIAIQDTSTDMREFAVKWLTDRYPKDYPAGSDTQPEDAQQ